MPKKRLDDTTLEAIAEVICGGGEAGGGQYDSPGPYRTKSEICAFFRRAGVDPQGQSSTRKWFVLESLQSFNEDAPGDLIAGEMERVLIRLTTPKEYRGDLETTRKVIDHLNQLLQVEGLEIVLLGIEPHMRERAPSASVAKTPKKQHYPPPEFHRMVSDQALADILKFRWEEAQRCMDNGAHLASVVMMGSVLEGVLLHKVETNTATACRAAVAPRNRKTGKTRPIHEWGLSVLVDVAHEVGWLQGDVKRFSHALRQSRNIVHPYVQRSLDETPDLDTCSICWQVVRAAVADLLGTD